MSTKVCVLGAGGRMGQSVMRAISERDDVTLVAAVDRPGGPAVGADCGRLIGRDATGVVVTDALDAATAAGTVIIDFSAPSALAAVLPTLREAGAALVTGTTGLSMEQMRAVEAAAETLPIVRADNFSVGVVLMRMLARRAAEVLGDSADIEIIEAHHRQKVDAPSGTALAVGHSIADGLGVVLDEHADWTRHGQVGPRGEGRIGFSVIRGGDIVGEHTAMFALEGERLEITHRATDRMIFARGAVRAAAWVAHADAGLHTVEDMLA